MRNTYFYFYRNQKDRPFLKNQTYKFQKGGEYHSEMNRCNTNSDISLSDTSITEMLSEDIVAHNDFLFFTFGVALSIIICIGIPGNCFALIILMHRSLRSSPVSIVKALTIHGIFNMCFSIYQDIIPSIKLHMETENFNRDMLKTLSQNKCKSNVSFASSSIFQCFKHIDVYVNTTNSLLAQMKPVYNRLVNGTTFGHESAIIKKCIFDKLEAFHFYPDPVPNESISNYDLRVDFTSEAPFGADNFTLDRDVSYFIENAVERFIGYTLVNYGLVITFCLAIERCVAIYFPFQAVRWLTIRKTRISLFLILLGCVCIHLPQMAKEIKFAKTTPSSLHQVGDDTLLFVEPIRQEYEQFYALISLIICVATFSLNILVLVKLIILHRRLKYCKHLVNAERTEINITVAIVVLIFFQLPFHIMASTIAFIQSNLKISNVNSLLKITVLIRFFFISQSALNFIIYCILARNCRKVCRILFRKLSLSFTRKTTSFTHHDDKLMNERIRRIYSNSVTTAKPTEKEDVHVRLNPLDDIQLETLLEYERNRLKELGKTTDSYSSRTGRNVATKVEYV